MLGRSCNFTRSIRDQRQSCRRRDGDDLPRPLARPKGFTRTVALKMLRPECANDPNFIAMFIDESNLVAKLAHPNIVQVYELGEEDGQLFIAMEMLFGETLADIWATCRARHGRLRAISSPGSARASPKAFTMRTNSVTRTARVRTSSTAT